MARRNRGAAVVCAFERGGGECSSSFGKKGTGVMDGTGGRTGGILPITGQAGGPEEAVRERVPSTGLDPATFATDLGMLAIQGFGDMREQARDTMIRDKFIAGQEQCARRRQLDGFAQGTPIGEIVDSCRVWESHSDLNWMAKTGYDSENGDQSGDARTRTRKKVGGMMEEWEPKIEKQRTVQEMFTRLWQQVESVDAPPTGIMIRNSQSWGRRGRPERSPDRPIPMTPRGTGDHVDTRYRPLGIRTGECDRRGTFGRFGKGTIMFGRGVSRNP